MTHRKYGDAKKEYCEHCSKKSEVTIPCGYVVKTKLTIHHIDENNTNDNPTNLMTLCRKCHDKVHNMCKKNNN